MPHNDDTGMRILRLAREPGDKRTGTFTSGVISIVGANPFEYLTALQRHSAELKQNPSEWMPWNYRDTLARLATPWPRNVMGPAWAKRIDSGQADLVSQKYLENAPSASLNRTAFRPATHTAENVAGVSVVC